MLKALESSFPSPTDYLFVMSSHACLDLFSLAEPHLTQARQLYNVSILPFIVYYFKNCPTCFAALNFCRTPPHPKPYPLLSDCTVSCWVCSQFLTVFSFVYCIKKPYTCLDLFSLAEPHLTQAMLYLHIYLYIILHIVEGNSTMCFM